MQDPAAAPARWFQLQRSRRCQGRPVSSSHETTRSEKQQSCFHTLFVFVSLRSVSTGPGPGLPARYRAQITFQRVARKTQQASQMMQFPE